MEGFDRNKNYWAENLNHHNLWGWKDPRNTITLDLWREVYPEAKIIHVFRNPVDVAASLMTREKRFDQNGKIRWQYAVIKYYIKWGVIARRAPELINLRNGIRLWEFYIKKALGFEENILHVKYEQMLVEPRTIITQIAEFLSLDMEEINVDAMSEKINPDRKYAFLDNPSLVEIYNSIKNDEFVKKLGYDNLSK